MVAHPSVAQIVARIPQILPTMTKITQTPDICTDSKILQKLLKITIKTIIMAYPYIAQTIADIRKMLRRW